MKVKKYAAIDVGSNAIRLLIMNIIDLASQRGAFKANEMAAVGTTYNKLDGFLKIVEKSQKDANKAPAEGDKKEAEKK